MTWDRGMELAADQAFTKNTSPIPVYFCDPQSRGNAAQTRTPTASSGNTFPEGTNLSRISQSYLNAIALRLNQRPRKTLGFQTPADRLQAVLH